MYVLMKDETKATSHAMPDETIGATEFLDDVLRDILFSTNHERQVFLVQYDPNSTILN